MAAISEDVYGLFEDAYRFFNERLFSAELPGCVITFRSQPQLMGYVAFKRFVTTEGKRVDELAINPSYFANYPLTSVLQTLCHEMVHIWQEYRGTPSRPGYHNSEWAHKMKTIGLMPSATGEPGGAAVGQTMSDYVIEGGSFEKVCRELIGSGFKLHYFDTVQMPPPLMRRAARSTPSNVIPLTHAKEIRGEQQHASVNADFPLDIDEIARVYEEDFREEQRRLLFTAKPTTTKTKHSATRNKYYCPRCFIKAWGKPSLNILCIDCDEKLIEEN